MSALEKVKSGYDIELIVGSEALRHFFQLLMDTGAFPRSFPLGGIDVPLAAASGITRTYTAYPGAEYASENAESLAVTTYDFGNFDSNFVYLSIRINTGVEVGSTQLDVYIKVQKEIDLAKEFAKIIAYVDSPLDKNGNPAISYDILEIFSVVAVLGKGVVFNTENPELNITSPVFQAIVDDFNASFTAFITDLRDGVSPEVVDFLRAQLDSPLTIPLLEKIAFKTFPNTKMGVYLNFLLLAHDSGFIGDRGNTRNAEDFLPSDDSYAIGTSPLFTTHLLDDILIKAMLQFRLDNDEMTEGEVEDALKDKHFPLIVSLSAFGVDLLGGDKDDAKPSDNDGDGAVQFKVHDTSISTESYTFEDANGNKTKADSLKVKIKVNADLWKFISLVDENIVMYLTPIDRTVDGFTVADAGIDVNMQMDIGNTFINAYVTKVIGSIVPLYTLKLLLVPIIAIINLIGNKRKELAGFTLSESGIEELARLTISSTRWDPFYTCNHDFLFQKRQYFIEDNRIFISGLPALAKTFTPFATVYPRDVSFNGDEPSKILYRVEGISAIVTDNQFATDRESFIEETEDTESYIYSLARNTSDSGSAVERIANGKLEPYIPFSSYYITPDGKDFDHRIDKIAMLSDEEVSDIENRLKNEWLDSKTTDIMNSLANIGFHFTQEQYDQTYALEFELVKDSNEYSNYLADEFNQDVKDAIFEEGTIRLSLAPQNTAKLIEDQIIELHGYVIVSRKGVVYMRNVADKLKDNNLLNLPPHS